MCRVSGFVPKSGRRSGEKTVLTRKQNELLMFINKRLNDDGVSPSFDEMKEALRLKSKSGIHRLITGLEERGFLRRLPHRARALQVLKLPDTAAMPAPNVMPMLARAGMAESREAFVPPVVRLDRARARQRRLRNADLRTRPGQDPGTPRRALSPVQLTAGLLGRFGRKGASVCFVHQGGNRPGVRGMLAILLVAADDIGEPGI